MGYRAIAYGVDLKRLQQVWGCRDRRVFDETVEACRARIQSHDTFLSADPERGIISINDALEDIISGGLRDSSVRNAFQYLYALELLCLRLGIRLDGGDSIGAVEDLGWETRLQAFRIPLPLPAAPSFPFVSHLTASEVKEEYEEFDSRADEDVGKLDREIEDAREDFLWWLKQCAEKRLALVMFSY